MTRSKKHIQSDKNGDSSKDTQPSVSTGLDSDNPLESTSDPDLLGATASADQTQASHLITIHISGKTVPENTNPHVWALLLKLNEEFDKSEDQQISLNLENATKISELQSAQNITSDDVQQLKIQNAQLTAQVDMLYSKMSLLESRVDMNSRQNTDLTVRSMQQNIVISVKKDSNRMPENRDRSAPENCKEIVEKILIDIMGLDSSSFEVIRAHRLGQYSSDYCRPMVARLGSKSQVFEVLKHGKRLNGTGIYVNKQLPSSVDERRRFCLDYSKSLKTDQPDAKVKLSDGRLFVNGNLNRALLAPILPPSNEHSIKPLKLIKSLPKTTPTCSYQAIACAATNMQDIRHALDRAAAESKGIHAIGYAYRFNDGDILRENYDSGSALTIGYDLLCDLRDRDYNNTMFMVTMRFIDPLSPTKGAGFKRGLAAASDECFGSE